MIRILNNDTFVLETKGTTYAFKIMKTGQLMHLYYGPKIHVDCDTDLSEKQSNIPGNTVAYSNENTEFSLEDVDLEASFYGKGDIREPMIECVSFDGSTTLDFVYDSYEMLDEKPSFTTLPTSYISDGVEQSLEPDGDEDSAEKSFRFDGSEENKGQPAKADGSEENAEKSSMAAGDAVTLAIKLVDKNHGFTLILYYTAFEDTDVITRSAVFINSTNQKVVLKRAMGLLIDFPESGYKITSFHGGWANEMNRCDTVLTGGKFVNSSFTGTSSSRSNPLTLMAHTDSTEDSGLVFGFNPVYSGNHYTAFEVNSFGKTRVVSGINPSSFSYTLYPEEKFEIPEAVLTVSKDGYNGVSENFHCFVSKHIVRGLWRDKERPVLLNSWEANYFNISEDKLVRLAKKGKDLGIELFVMDDGWFGERNSDKSSLGDWTENKKKLPHGLKGLSEKIHALGMDFGIWIEPEMVNVDSELYRNHPEFVIEIPGERYCDSKVNEKAKSENKASEASAPVQSEGRNQRLLDFSNPSVVDLLFEKISVVLKSAEINYVKWDFNRIFSDVYSKHLPYERQGEVLHRYVMGFYSLAKRLTEAYPEILFEGCAAGGNRFDLGALCYFPQIWASDNTDAVSRLSIQGGLSYGYPASAYTCHISASPNHQTLHETALLSRAAVAYFGSFGLELNLLDAPSDELETLKRYIEFYKKYRRVFQYGSFYRGRSGNITEWTAVSPDKRTAVGMIFEKETHAEERHLTYFPKGLDLDKKYHFYNIPEKVSIKEFGDLINAAGLPVHIKPDSLIHNAVDRFYKLDGDREDTVKYGDTLMNAGQRLTESYSGTGINNVRVFKGYDARVYVMEEVE